MKNSIPQDRFRRDEKPEDVLKNYKKDILQEPLPEPLEKLLSSVQKGREGRSPRTK